MDYELIDDDIYSGEPVPLWLEEQMGLEEETEQIEGRMKEEEGLGIPKSIEGYSDAGLAIALLAGSALAIFFVGYLNRRSNNAERRPKLPLRRNEEDIWRRGHEGNKR